MKKILFTLLSFIVFCGGAWAADGPEITIEEVDVVIGKTGTLLINLNPNGEQCRDLQIDVTIPEGFEFVSWAKGPGVEHSLGKNEVDTPSGLTGSTIRLVLSDNGGALLPEGDILKIVVKDKGNHEEGQTFSGAATTVILSANILQDDGTPNGVKDFKFSNIPFTVKIVEDAYHLYEDFVATEEVSSQIEAYEGDVRVHRSLKAGQWNTIVLPFAMTEQQVIDCFGDDVQLGEYSGSSMGYLQVRDGKDEEGKPKYKSVLSLNLQFSSVTPRAIEAHKPYIIMTESIGDIDAETGFKVVNTSMSKYTEQVQIGTRPPYQYMDMEVPPYAVAGDDVFEGTYEMRSITSIGTGAYPTYYAYLSGNKFYYLDNGESAEVKGFRGYFYIPNLIEWISVKNGAGANVNIFVDDDQVTGIDGITTSIPAAAEGVYDIQGRKVSNDLKSLKKGVYIIDGKKVVVK